MTTRPLYLLITLVLPLLSFFIFWTIFKTGIPTDLPISVYDADNSQTSRRITRLLDATPMLAVAEKVNSVDEGRQLILQGRCHALVVLPGEMEKDLAKKAAPQVVSFYNNEFLLIGSLVDKEIRSVVQTVSKGIDASTRQALEMPEAAMEHVQPVAVGTHVLFNPSLNYFYFLTGTLQPAMLQIFILIMTIFAFGIELKEGSGPALFDAAGGRLDAILIGKLLPYTAIYILMGLFMNIYLFRIPGFPFRGDLRVMVLATILFVLAYQAVGMFMISLTANLRKSLSLAGFYSSTAFAFSGVTFPSMGMPLFAKFWGAGLPLTHYIRIFVDQSMKGTLPQVSIPDLCCLSFFILGGFFLSGFRVKKILTDPAYRGLS